MNFKKERRMAEAQSVGRPYAAYTRNRDNSLVLHLLCTKAIYKQLKKEARGAKG